jgi:outer membrane autotransporter protein
MHKVSYSTKILTAAVLASLLAATPVWAAEQNVTRMVTASNTDANPYASIAVTETTSHPTSAGDLPDTFYAVNISTDSGTNQLYVTDSSTISVTATNSMGAVYVSSIYNDTNQTLTVSGTPSLTAAATAGTNDNSSVTSGDDASASAVAQAYGLRNGQNFEGNTGTVTTADIKSITVTAAAGQATAGTASSSSSDTDPAYAGAEAFASATGIETWGPKPKEFGNIGSITATAKAGTATGGTATASDGSSGAAGADARAYAAGIYDSGGTVNVGDLSDLEVSARGGKATVQQSGARADGRAYAYGVAGLSPEADAVLNVSGNVKIITSATAGTETDATGKTSPAKFGAYSLFASQGTKINIGVDTSKGYPAANGKTVQLEGDIFAYGKSTNNVILSGSASSLQGNILNESDTDSNNITFTNQATWHPVFDNRYGSFITDGDDTTYSPSYTVNSISTAANLTLSDKAAIDLTWDNATRDPATAARTLTLASLSGADGILVVNTNLAQNAADQFVITNNAATSLGIDVAYDPALAVSGLNNNSSITGQAKVLTISAGTTPTVTGVKDSYNTYDYTPTITANGDGTYSVTKLTITNMEPPTKTLTSPSKPMRDARNDRMALHNLWVNGELNNLEKRMGDLRALEPAASGIWARYEHNKLEKGSDASLKYNYFQLGFDKDFKGGTGTFYRGAAFSYAKGTGDYENATGDLKEGTLSLYQTWIGQDGRYYDVILKGGKLMSSYDLSDTTNPSSADYHSWAYSLSGEVGKRFKKNNGFYLEPQLEFILGKINGADYTTSTGMDVNIDSQSTAIARLGVAAGREIKNVGSYYAKASYYHDFGGGLNLTASDSTTNPYSYGEDSAKNWAVFTLGGAVKAGKNCNIYGELSKFAGQLSNDVQVNIGARWSF